MTVRCKDFEIKGFREGSRIEGKPEYAYKVIFHNCDGRTLELHETFYTKDSAKKHISNITKKMNALMNKAKES